MQMADLVFLMRFNALIFAVHLFDRHEGWIHIKKGVPCFLIWISIQIVANKWPVTIGTLNSTDLSMDNSHFIPNVYQQNVMITTVPLNSVFNEQYSLLSLRPVKRRSALKNSGWTVWIYWIEKFS